MKRKVVHYRSYQFGMTRCGLRWWVDPSDSMRSTEDRKKVTCSRCQRAMRRDSMRQPAEPDAPDLRGPGDRSA